MLRNTILAHLVSQFERPRGPLGRVAGRIMARRGSNVDRNLHLVELLELKPDHAVMELGPGPGVALEAAARTVTRGRLVAVDHSVTMLRQTAARNRSVMDDGRLTLVRADARHLDLELEGFDRIFAMNVWQFWPNQEWVVADLARRLAPGGRLVLGYQPRHPGATAADADAARRCLRDQFTDVGLAVEDDVRHDLEPPVVYVMGEAIGDRVMSR